MDEVHPDDQWGGWLMADVALVLVFLLVAGTGVGRAVTADHVPTPTSSMIATVIPSESTIEATPTVVVEATPTVEPAGMDPELVRIRETAASPEDLPRVAAALAAQVRDKAEGRRPAMLLVFGTAFRGSVITSGGSELSGPVIERLAVEFADDPPVFREFLQIPGTHGEVFVDVYYYVKDQ